MKNSLLIIIVMTVLSGFTGCADSTDPSVWSSKKIDQWFEKGDWLNGWQVKPDQSIDRKEFVVSYFKNRERWDKAFSFLKNSDLQGLELKRYDIDGDDLYAPVSEYLTKNEEDARYEAHRKYADIQYVAAGKEMIGVAPLSSRGTILQAYDEKKDIEFAEYSNGKLSPATPDIFFVFFPEDGHMPSVKAGTVSPVKKVVVKVKLN